VESRLARDKIPYSGNLISNTAARFQRLLQRMRMEAGLPRGAA